MFHYARKFDLKKRNRCWTSKFAKKVDLANLKREVDKLDIVKLEKVPTGFNSLWSKADKLDDDKLVPAPVDLSKLCDAVKNDVDKKTKDDELVKNLMLLRLLILVI